MKIVDFDENWILMKTADFDENHGFWWKLQILTKTADFGLKNADVMKTVDFGLKTVVFRQI